MLWLIMAGVAVIVVVVPLWWWWPKWEVNRLSLKIRDAKARADVEDNFRKTVGQFFGGAVVLVGAGIAYYQTQRTSHLMSSLSASKFRRALSSLAARRRSCVLAASMPWKA